MMVWTVARVAGIPVRLHGALVLMLTLLLAAAGWRFGALAAAQTAALSVGLLLSVTAHELGHAAMAARHGIPSVAILLTPMGGAVQMAPRRVLPWVDVVVALAGPAVSLLLAVFFGSLAAISGAQVVRALAALNLGLGLFNLVPALPLDGGRVLRGLLVMRYGARVGGRVSLAVAVVLTAVLAILGVWSGQLALLTVALFMVLLQRREWALAR